MNAENLTLSPQTQALAQVNKAAPSNKGTTDSLLSAMLTGQPALGPLSTMSGLISAAFQEDPGNMTFLPSFDGGKLDVGAATKTTVFGPIQTGGSAASGWSKATSSPQQTAPMEVSPNTPSPLSSSNFPLVIVAGLVLLVGAIAILR